MQLRSNSGEAIGEPISVAEGDIVLAEPVSGSKVVVLQGEDAGKKGVVKVSCLAFHNYNYSL